MIAFLEWMWASPWNFCKFMGFLFIMWFWFLFLLGIVLEDKKLSGTITLIMKQGDNEP